MKRVEVKPKNNDQATNKNVTIAASWDNGDGSLGLGPLDPNQQTGVKGLLVVDQDFELSVKCDLN